MSPLAAYLWGFATPFLTVGAAFVLIVCYIVAARILNRFGFSFDHMVQRDVQEEPPFHARNDDWAERYLWRLPIFVGHWRRITAHHDGEPFVTRWIGVGNRHGRCTTFFHKRVEA